MQRDRYGNIIFMHSMEGDAERMHLINAALDNPASTDAGKNQAASNSRAKAMIDAGLIPDVDDTTSAQAIPVGERVTRFLRWSHRIPAVVIREDEVDQLCSKLRKTTGYKFNNEKEGKEANKQAKKLAKEMKALEEGEVQ